jgi:hypothetical protein
LGFERDTGSNRFGADLFDGGVEMTGRNSEVRELRIHGVGGSPGEALLGLRSPDEAVVVGEGLGTAFLARRYDEEGRRVEGYDWGALTSSSPLQPLWIVLLPFTLLNVAGWMHPSFDSSKRRRIQVIQLLVHVLGILLTITWTLWSAILLVDLVGYQLVPRLFGPQLRLLGLIAGLVATSLAMFGLYWIGRNTKQQFEAKMPARDVLAHEERPTKWAWNETLRERTFFAHERAVDKRLGLHALAVGATLIAVALKSASAFGEDRLLIGQLFTVVGCLQSGLLITLALASWRTGGQGVGIRRPRMRAAAAAAVAFALTNGFFSALVLLVGKRIITPVDYAGEVEKPWGPELAALDLFLAALLLWAIVTLVFVWKWARSGTEEGLRTRESPIGQELDGVDSAYKRKIKRTRGLAEAGHRADAVLTFLALAFVLLTALGALLRFQPSLNPLLWLEPPDATNVGFQVAQWLLPASLLAAMAVVRQSASTVRLRRSIGILWDVLTFWPRRFHPFAVRPYTERAVPEFQGRVNYHVQERRRVLVSAHSQGSVIAFAALAPLKREKLARIALVTYGCPISTLYGPLFPAYFGDTEIQNLRSQLARGEELGWRNFWRKTDPIGGPVFGSAATAHPQDVELADPAEKPPSSEIPYTPAPVEDDRRAWVEIAGHSHFFRERELREWVANLKRWLGNGREVAPDRESTGAS